jgi:hypothetical protein
VTIGWHARAQSRAMRAATRDEARRFDSIDDS